MNLLVDPPLHSPEPPSRRAKRPILRRTKEPILSRCPCGQQVEAQAAGHVLCAKHREQVLSGIRRRFGSHRYGARYAHHVEDFVQECYLKLLNPGGLDSFQPQTEHLRADAFGAWLWRVVQNYCHNKWKAIECRPTEVPEDAALESSHELTPDQAFARKCLDELIALAVADVEAKWKATGDKRARRFEVFVSFLSEENSNYDEAERQLGVSNVLAKQLKHKLSKEVLQAVRGRVRDTLYLEPGLEPDEVERRIEAEIQALFDAAFPPEAVLADESEPEAEKPTPAPVRAPPSVVKLENEA